MNKKFLYIIIGVVIVILILVVGVIVGILVMKKSNQKSEDQLPNDQTVTTQSVGIEEEVFNESLENYDEVNSVRAEGVIVEKSLDDEVQVTAMSKSTSSNYLYLSVDNEELSIYSEDKDQKTYVYVSDGKDTIMFEVEEGEESEDIYDEVMQNDPTSTVQEVDDYEDPDYEIEYIGVEDCREMKCHKYEINDYESSGKIIVWVDTEDRFPRILKYETNELNGLFDVYYDNVKFETPKDYEEIDLENVSSLQKLYNIVGDFLDIFL